VSASDRFFWLRVAHSRRYLRMDAYARPSLVRRRRRATVFCAHQAPHIAQVMRPRFGAFELEPVSKLVQAEIEAYL
jgi:hypothetical protein